MTDLISWRAWSAEHALPSETPLHTSDDVDSLVRAVNPSWYDKLLRCHERAAAMPSKWRHIV